MTTHFAVGTDGQYRFSRTDAAATFRHLGDLWDLLIDDLDDDVVDRSGVTLVGGEMVDALTTALDVPIPDSESISDALAALGADAASRVVSDEAALGDHTPAELLTATWLRLFDVGDQLRAAGAFSTQPRPGATATVEQINASGGGVPKLPVDGAVNVRWGGLDGDTQGNRVHHGRPWQALCLWSVDVMNDLRAEGHPVELGAVGENIAIRGLDWSAVRPGVRLQLGDVTCVVSSWATPCKKIAGSFIDGDFNRISERRGSAARAYASVVTPGSVSAGDRVTAA